MSECHLAGQFGDLDSVHPYLCGGRWRGEGRGMKGEVVEGEWYMGEVECVSVYE